MTVDLRDAAYAASRISSTLKGSTKQFGWLQAAATKVSSLSITSANPAPSEFVIFVAAEDVEDSSSYSEFKADAPVDHFRFARNPSRIPEQLIKTDF